MRKTSFLFSMLPQVALLLVSIIITSDFLLFWRPVNKTNTYTVTNYIVAYTIVLFTIASDADIGSPPLSWSNAPTSIEEFGLARVNVLPEKITVDYIRSFLYSDGTNEETYYKREVLS